MPSSAAGAATGSGSGLGGDGILFQSVLSNVKTSMHGLIRLLGTAFALPLAGRSDRGRGCGTHTSTSRGCAGGTLDAFHCSNLDGWRIFGGELITGMSSVGRARRGR